ncbi:hypothetical protein T484DRAFT_1798477 [Baffinella frigidus]|nr:hypothetical protein T484DRAFT_1798477 [Cryptophyta sp. CCMP2293]
MLRFSSTTQQRYPRVHRYIQRNTNDEGALTDAEHKSDAGWLTPLDDVVIPGSIQEYVNNS